MASNQFRSGPADCIVFKNSTTATLSTTFSALSFTASGTDLSSSVYNSIKSPLLTTTTYQVVLAPMGADPTGGYAFGIASPSSGNLVVTAGQGIRISVAVGAWPSNFSNGLVGVFLKTGSGNFQYVKCFDPSTSGTSETVILRAPLAAAESFLLSTLQSTTNPLNQRALGTIRTGLFGWDRVTVSPTTDSVNCVMAVGNSVTYTPNSSSDFTVAGARPLNVSFQGMINSEDAITTAGAGDWGKWTNGGTIYEEAEWGINTTQIIAKGNTPFIMNFPADPSTLAQTKVLFTGLLLQNQEEVSLAWSKSAQTAIPYNFQAAALDALNTNASTVFTHVEYV